ncbi:cobalamin-binding protein [Herbaspirillum sp. meg3]|uniref:cobalamin-binding protein n=1 Tax=Herbaspirillum sp. meg3 TaxID=2025949 RepID=UPI000B98A1C8|nr:cobalamin-binding protein [Herbaspirillum sp. meg3]ASU39507.1 cobalamin-binding protein [Herbaspirillum sp. meg3]
MRRWLAATLIPLFCVSSAAANIASATGITVKDDYGDDIHLERPARRIVSLSPHTTELLYAAGAGPYVVGVSHYSNYPPQALQVASVGRISAVDIEKILTLKPDLIVAWHSGNAAAQLQKLRSFGLPVFESQPADYATIATSLERLAALSGTENIGNKAAADFRARWQGLTRTYRDRQVVSVFYQIWGQPLMTLNGQHMVSAVLRTCGGSNIFADLPQLAPHVSLEAVIAADPDAILAPDDAKDHPLDDWRRFGKMKAVSANTLFTVNADWLNRPGPRILDATAQVCEFLDQVRTKRSKTSPSLPQPAKPAK